MKNCSRKTIIVTTLSFLFSCAPIASNSGSTLVPSSSVSSSISSSSSSYSISSFENTVLSSSLSEYEEFITNHPDYTGDEKQWKKDVNEGNTCNLYGHTYETKTVEATYKEGGYDIHICQICGDSYTDNYKDIIPHEHKSEKGLCVYCGDKIYSQNLSFSFNQSLNEYAVSGIGSCTDDYLMIPEKYNDLPVTSIGEYAFAGNHDIKGATLPNTIRSIESHAFYDAKNLSEITLSDNTYTIGSCAFSENKSLIHIDLPDTLNYIGEYCFTGCDYLEDLMIPNRVETICDQAFSYCYSIETVFVPLSVKNMGISVFSWCISMIDVYCECEFPPSTWDSEWMYGCNADVHFNSTRTMN